MKRFYLVFSLVIFLTLSFQPLIAQQDFSGKYRLIYPGKPIRSGWPIDNKEELLILKKDSTFVIELISQGGFEKLPETGIWTVKNKTIILEKDVNKNKIEHHFKPKTRKFKLVVGGLLEPKCTERVLRKTIWIKE